LHLIWREESAIIAGYSRFFAVGLRIRNQNGLIPEMPDISDAGNEGVPRDTL